MTPRFHRSTLALSLGLVACAAHAQSSSVTIYGIIDAGITHYSKAPSGGSLWAEDTGVAQANRIGFRGEEDLGGGRFAFFTLESGFLADTGALGQGGLAWGRQSFVGIGDKTLGRISLGRQYDFMTSIGAAYTVAALSAAGAMAWGLHADAAHGTALNDHTYAGDRTNNAIKYQSANYGGVTFGAMLGLGEVAGNNRAGRTLSAIASYDQGPLSTGGAYTEVRDATGLNATRIWGLGGRYQIGAFTPFALVTRVRQTATGAQAMTYEAGSMFQISSAANIGVSYQYQDRNQGVGSAKAIGGAFDYALSKRTDVYVAMIYDRDQGYAAYPVFGGGVQSSNGTQFVYRVGMRHRF